MERAQGELKRKNSELSDMIDPGTQLVKSMSVMMAHLQTDMEAKRNSDSEIIKLVLQGQSVSVPLRGFVDRKRS